MSGKTKMSVAAVAVCVVLGLAVPKESLANGRVFIGARFGWGWDWGWPYSYGGFYGPPVYYAEPYGPVRLVPPHIGAVELHVHPWKATVTIDGRVYGEARDFNASYDPLWLDAGPHSLELSREGYKTLRVPLEVRPGGQYSLHYSLDEGDGIDPRSVAIPARPASSGPGRLLIHVAPPDAAVYLDGRFLGRADQLAHGPGFIAVKPGAHHVEAVRPGFETHSVDVEVHGGRPSRVLIDLQPSHDA